MIVGETSTVEERLRLVDLIAEHSRLTVATLQSAREPSFVEIQLSKNHSKLLAERINQLYENYGEE